MTKWQYWSPLFIGGVVGEIFGLQAFKDVTGNPLIWMGVLPLLVALIGAVQFQLIMFAAQAFFAAVLPVPVGKSIRGTKCRLIGFLMLFGPLIALFFKLSGALVYLGIQRHTLTVFWQIWFIGWGTVGALCYPAALLIYLYSVPTAKPDFGAKD
ncbi:MAG: hypothetical protein JXB13_01940 [Phycisphaerae bacterium]|nr:hypothetical protein [Phycisphaerae bacterium]